MNRFNKLRYKITLAVASFLMSVCLAEFITRVYIYHQNLNAGYAIQVLSEQIIVDGTPGIHAPDLSVTLWQLDADHRPLVESHFKTNNWGFISRKDYALEKAPGEYRIAVLGDSFTACVNSDIQWPDALEDLLNGDATLKAALGADSFCVLNGGQPGVGFQTFAYNYASFLEPFSPDVVLINYIEMDFQREKNWNLVDRMPEGMNRTVGTRVPEEWRRKTVRVGEVEVSVGGNHLDDYADPLQCPNVVPDNFICKDRAIVLDRDRMFAAKRELASRYLEDRIWWTLHPFLIDVIMGRRPRISYLDQVLNMFYEDPAEMVAHAAKAIRAIQARHPKVILIRNPLGVEMKMGHQTELTDRLRASLPGTTVLMGSDSLPGASREEMATWFTHDGHWSDAGARAYAKTVQQAIQQNVSAFKVDRP